MQFKLLNRLCDIFITMTQNLNTAKPYARAIFALAKEQQELPVWSGILLSLGNIVQNTKILSLASDPRCSKDQLLQLIEKVLGQKIPGTILTLIKLLLTKRKLAILPAIAAVLIDLDQQENKSITINITTAQPLSELQKKHFKKALEKTVQMQILPEYQINSAIIGGIVLRQNDYVIDASIYGALQRLESKLMGSSIT